MKSPIDTQSVSPVKDCINDPSANALIGTEQY